MSGNPLPFTMQQPLQCERAAAKIFGSDCAIVLQRFVWWTCPANGRSKIGSLDENGYKWVYFTLEDLEAEFDWLSRSTIRRIIKLLEDNHLLISKQPEGWNSRRKHYSVRWPMWLKVQSGEFCGLDSDGRLIPSGQIDHAQIEQASSAQKEQQGAVQKEQFLTNCNVLRPLAEKSGANDQPGILAGRYLVPTEEELKAEQADPLKTTASHKGEAPRVPPPPQKGRFSPPSVDECVAYGDSIGLPCIEAEKFANYHESKGWIVGKSPMKSWQAAMRTWKLNWQARMSEGLSSGHAAHAKPKPVWLQIKELEAKIESHPGNHNWVRYDSTKVKQVQKDEYRSLKAQLANLKAGQPNSDQSDDVIP